MESTFLSETKIMCYWFVVQFFNCASNVLALFFVHFYTLFALFLVHIKNYS